MIGKLTGLLAEKNPPQVLVDVNGVGYLVDVPMSTFYDLPELGAKTSLLIHMVVREDAQLLYGFLSASERDAFRQLIKISGVGPRTALAVLSGMSVDELARCVATQDATRMTKTPGIGKKTAERLILELRGKIADAISPGTVGVPDNQADILNALLALGYSEKEASSALKHVPAGSGVSEGIKFVLKSLA